MKTLKKELKLILAAVLGPLSFVNAADPVVTNVTAAQRAGTKLVDITFQVSDADSDQLDISVNVSDDAGATFQVPSSALTGDTNVNATPSATSKALVWDAGIDFNQQFSTDMVVRVIADDGTAAGPPPPGMKLIPAGVFQRGDASGSGSTADEPVHPVFISSFYMGKYEVTWELWQEVKTYADAHGYTFENAGMGQGAHHPVHTVNWYDAIKWCNARSEMEGLTPCYYTNTSQTIVYRTGQTGINNDAVQWSAHGYRLPTEAEWEKAARGGVEGREYPWGNSIGNEDANYNNSADPFEFNDGTVETAPVGFYDGGQVPGGEDRANGYGLYDMAGNVREWCWDAFGSGPDGPDWYEEVGASQSDTRGPNISAGGRVPRGGSWGIGVPLGLRCATNRGSVAPVNEDDNIGFRCARGL